MATEKKALREILTAGSVRIIGKKEDIYEDVAQANGWTGEDAPSDDEDIYEFTQNPDNTEEWADDATGTVIKASSIQEFVDALNLEIEEYDSDEESEQDEEADV